MSAPVLACIEEVMAKGAQHSTLCRKGFCQVPAMITKSGDAAISAGHPWRASPIDSE